MSNDKPDTACLIPSSTFSLTISMTKEVLQGGGAGDDCHGDQFPDNQEPHHQQQGHVQHAGVEGTLEEDTEGSRGGEKMASFHDDLLQQDGVQGSLPAHPSTVLAHEGNHKGTHLVQGLGPHAGQHQLHVGGDQEKAITTWKLEEQNLNKN